MVVYAVGEPHLLQVLFHRLEVGVVAVAVVFGVYVLQGVAHGEVVLEILVEQYVATAFGRLGQVVYQLLLLQRQVLEFGNIVETIHYPRHAVGCRLFGVGRLAAA